MAAVRARCRTARGDGESNYNAWEIEVQKRFSNGLLFDVNYAWARAFNYQYQASDPVSNPLSRYDYGPVPAQPNSVFHWNYVYELPYGRGKRLGSVRHPVVRRSGGWQLSGIGTWQSGHGADSTRGSRPKPDRRDCESRRPRRRRKAWTTADCRAERRHSSGSIHRPTGSRHLSNPSCDASDATVRHARAVGTVYGPSFFTFDTTAQKNFYIAEKYKLQFRVEVFNPFNVVMLADPDINASSANFGRIRTSNMNYTPRNIQLGMSLDF